MADLSIIFHAMRGSKRLAPARMVQILGVRLRGAARLFHAELEDNTRTNWEELTAAMALRFDQPHWSNLHTTAFRSRKKKPEETLLESQWRRDILESWRRSTRVSVKLFRVSHRIRPVGSG